MTITKEQLQAIAPVSDKSVETFLPYINKYSDGLETPKAFAAFIANVLHESGCLRYVHELASGEAYEGRLDLGNVNAGDGKKFKGRGLIQITGRANYTTISKDWYGDDTLLKTPDLLATPENAVRSAYWFWHSRNLTPIAESGDFVNVVKRINGGTNGLSERQKYYDKALELLS